MRPFARRVYLEKIVSLKLTTVVIVWEENERETFLSKTFRK